MGSNLGGPIIQPRKKPLLADWVREVGDLPFYARSPAGCHYEERAMTLVWAGLDKSTGQARFFSSLRKSEQSAAINQILGCRRLSFGI